MCHTNCKLVDSFVNTRTAIAMSWQNARKLRKKKRLNRGPSRQEKERVVKSKMMLPRDVQLNGSKLQVGVEV